MHPIILFIGFFFFAVAYNLIGPLATNIMQTTGLTLTESGSLVSFQQVGALLSMIASLVLMKKLKQSTVAKIGYLFLILALTGIAFSTGNIALFVFYLVLGLGTFLIDSGSNATLASDYYEKRSLYIPLLHFCYSAGAIATGYLILPFKGANWPWTYAMIGIILFGILLAGMVEQKLRRKRDDGTKRSMEKSSPEMIQAGPILPILKDKPFIIYTAVIMLYMGSQVVCAAWIPVYVEIELVQPAAITATSLTVFWVGTAISRLIAGPLMNKGGKPFNLSIYGMVLAGLSLVMATLSSHIYAVLFFVMLCGFFAGATIPMYIVITSTWYPRNTAFISLSYILAGTIGRMIFPWLVTVIGSFTSLGFALLISSGLFFISAVLILLVKRLVADRPSF